VHAVFEAPKALSDGLELWIAATGSNASWGGCHVWISADGVEYKQVSTLSGKSRVGKFDQAATTSASFFKVKGMNDQLGSGSALDASLNATLCWANGEFFNYETATLTASGSYTLNGLLRGVYGSRRSSKAVDGVFVRCDGALAKTGPIGLQMVGRQIWIKLQSFNIFGLATQSLSDVSAVTYTPTGDLALAPDTPANLVPEGEFSLLPLGRRPDTWDGGTVTVVTGQSAFTAALDCSALRTQGLVRIGAQAGDRFWVTAMVDASTSSTSANAGMCWYDAQGQRLSSSSADVAVGAGATWIARAGIVEAPASVAYGVPCVERASVGSGVVRVADFSIARQLVTQELQDLAATELTEITTGGFSVSNRGSLSTDWAVVKITNGGRVIVRLVCDYVAYNLTGAAVGEVASLSFGMVGRVANDINSADSLLVSSSGGGAAISRQRSIQAYGSTPMERVVLSSTATVLQDGYVFVSATLMGLGFVGPQGQIGGNQARLTVSNFSMTVESVKK